MRFDLAGGHRLLLAGGGQAWLWIGAGVAAVIPFVAGIYDRVSHRVESRRGMQRRLDSLREDVGFPNDDDFV